MSEITKRIRVYGIVQGVGFRPTVSRHATRKPGGVRHTHGGEIMLTSTTKIALSSELHMCNPY